MAQPEGTTATTPPAVTAEPDPSQSGQLRTTAVTQENRHIATNLGLLPQSQEPQFPPPVPHMVNSIKELRPLSDALSAFYRCYDDLQTHLDAIKSAIESKLVPQLPNVSLPVTGQNGNPTNDNKTAVTQSQPSETPLNPSEENEEVKEKSIRPDQSEVESLCAMMSGKGLRKYMLSNLGVSNKLREEVPKALTLAPNPAKLVLECAGRFFLQGSRAYTKNSQMIPAREASVLTLECFLLMGGEDGVGSEVRIEQAIKQEAEQAAVAWRKRLIVEGGLDKASEIDARGLLLFLGCFGVPQVFKNVDMKDLVRASNFKEISAVLKRSKLLMGKIQDILEGMVKNKRTAVDAVDLAYTFGLQDKFSTQTMLTSFLRESKEFWKKTKKTSQGSLHALNDANRKQLAALRSVVDCLERHNLDVSNILPGWQISSQISKLEKDISDIDKSIRERTARKRKADDIDSSKKSKTQEYHTSHHIQIPAHHVDSQRHLLNVIPIHSSSSLASQTLLHGTSAAGLLQENYSGLVTGLGGSVRAGVTSSVPTGDAGLLPADPYAGSHTGVLYSAARRVIKPTSQPYVLHEDAAAPAYREQLVPHSYAGQSSSLGLTNLYRLPSSLEGLPSSSTVAGVSGRSSAGDLYQFADTVDNESSYYSRTSNPVGAVPPPAAAAPLHHHSSRLY